MLIHITIYDTEYILTLICLINKFTGIRRAEAHTHQEGVSANCGASLRNVSCLLIQSIYNHRLLAIFSYK